MTCEIFSVFGDLKEWVFVFISTLVGFFFARGIESHLSKKLKAARLKALKESAVYNIKLTETANQFDLHSFPFDTARLADRIAACSYDLDEIVLKELNQVRFELERITMRVAAMNAAFYTHQINHPESASKTSLSDFLDRFGLKEDITNQKAKLQTCLNTIDSSV